MMPGDSWATLDERSNIWEVSKEAHGLAGEQTTRYLTEELQGYTLDDVLGEDGKFKLQTRKKPFPDNNLEEDRFLKHVASQIKEKRWPRMEAHPKSISVTAFGNGLSVDWEEPDPFLAIVPTRKDWGLTRFSGTSIKTFVDCLVEKGKSQEEAEGIARKWLYFTDQIIDEKKQALIDNRDVDLEQFRGELEALLDDYPCVRHIFWEPFLTVRDMYCALQIRADAFSGKSQKAKRITAFCEFGCASANKGGRREMDEQTFGTHVPPEKMGFVFKMTSSEMSAKSQRGPWEAAANAEGSRLGYSDEWTRSSLMNNATFKQFHSGNSIDFDRKHKGKRQIDVPPPLIYLANDGFRFRDPVVDGEDRRMQILSCTRRIVPAEDYDSEDDTHILKDPRIKAESKEWSPEYVFVLICVARGCDAVQDDVPFPAPTKSKESVKELIGLAGPSTTVDNQSIAEKFLQDHLVRCPIGSAPSSRKDIIKALCEYAAKVHYSRATRDTLLRAFELLVNNPGEVSVCMPAKRTYYPYILPGQETKNLRMLRLKMHDETSTVGQQAA